MAPRRLRILEEWNTFSSEVIPADASEIQRIEMRRAFYAGACSIFNLVVNRSVEFSESEQVQRLSDLDDEVKDFANRIKDGTA